MFIAKPKWWDLVGRYRWRRVLRDLKTGVCRIYVPEKIVTTPTEPETSAVEKALKRDRKLVADYLFDFINNPDGTASRETKSTLAVLATSIQHGAHAK